VPRNAGSASYQCSICGFNLWLPLIRLDVSTLGLYDDARFPGRCILALHDHYEDLSEVELDLLQRFANDVRRAGGAIKAASDADRMNYAVLGNVEPHVHFHLIPRLFAIDPVPRRPPWEHPEPVSLLPPAEVHRLSDAIVDLLVTDPLVDRRRPA
jgi:diadenosine tetraphosphate (Ap4A) HIT family hydrolase